MALSEILRLAFAVLTGLLMLAAGGGKLAGQQVMRDAAAHFSVAWPRYRTIGYLELAAVVGIVLGFWVPGIGIAAGVGVVLLILGALVFHVRVGDPVGKMSNAILGLVFSVGYLAAQVAVSL